MTVIRRGSKAPPPAPVRRATFSVQQKVAVEDIQSGVKKMRRVWLKGKTGHNDPHWYFESYTRQGAINAMARASREPASNFDAED